MNKLLSIAITIVAILASTMPTPVYSQSPVSASPQPADAGSEITVDTVCAITESPSGSDSLLLQGIILAPDQVLETGEVLIDGQGMIACVANDCSQEPGAQNATVISCPEGVVSPALINAHDHLNFNQMYPGDWGEERFDQRHDWRKGLRGHTKIPAWSDNDPEVLAWNELRQLISGTVTVSSPSGGPGLVRNLTVSTMLLEGLAPYTVRNETFPLADSDGEQLEASCRYPESLRRRLEARIGILRNDVYNAHVAEGVDQVAHNEFLCLTGQQRGAMRTASEKSAFVHLVALRPPDAQVLKDSGTAVIWSPRSNISLYGATAPVTLFDTLRVQDIALSTDWTVSGSMNLLRELKCAETFNANHLDHHFTDSQLWAMVTSGAASTLDIDDQIGALAPGLVADIAVYDARDMNSGYYRTIIDAGPEDSVLVLRGGVALFGESAVVGALGQPGVSCETLPEGVCGEPRTVCLDNDLGLTLAELTAANGESYPLFFCGGPPTDEPTCEPLRTRPEDQWGCGGYPLDPTEDADGDGVVDSADNCPAVFNPATPLDRYYSDDPSSCLQSDYDKDGIGDVCDPDPLG